MAEEKQITPSTSRDPSESKSEGQPYSIAHHWKCLAACALMSLCLLQFGLDLGLTGGLPAAVGFLRVFGYAAPDAPGGWNISPVRVQLLLGLMSLGAFVGASMAGPIANVLSRRMAIWVACVVCIISNVIMMSTTNIGAWYFGRLLLGFANGLFMTFSQLYIQECSPARYRGLAISTAHAWISVGNLLGTVIDHSTAGFAGRNGYLIPIGQIYILPVLISLGLLLIPESPRWLAQQGKLDEARRALRWHRPGTDAEVDGEMKDIVASMGAERAAKNVVLSDLLSNPVDRRRTIVASTVLGLHGASGSAYITGKSLPAKTSPSAVVTRYGRRRVFLITGVLLCGLAQLLTAIVYTTKPGVRSAAKGITALSAIYYFAFNGLISTYAWTSCGELPSQRLRSYTFGLSAAVGFFFPWLTVFTARYFINPDSLNWGAKYGYIWVGPCCMAAIWVFLELPEVKGRTLEEIDEMFEAGLPPRAFRREAVVITSKA
ncbi:hypothetical protein VTH06DRAFT_3966 [Thermothelomyces fergusii]